MGSWVWDVVTDDVRWSDELYRIMGRDPATFIATKESFFASVHPDDHDRVRAASERNITSGIGEEVEYRVLRPDGTIRYVTTNATLLYDDAGQLRRAVGTVLDVTEAREAARELRRSADLFAEAQRIGKMGSFEVSGDDHRWNERLVQEVGDATGLVVAEE